MNCDDDAVRERALLITYGALILTRAVVPLREVCRCLFDRLAGQPDTFDNALVRDNVRCIAELAIHLGVLPDGCDISALRRPLDRKLALVLATDDEIERWKRLPKLEFSCLHDDFYTYSMSCLDEWEHAMPKNDMAKWILRRVADEMGYEGFGCEAYDKHMLGRYSAGREREVWAERIGKKYQWIAMYQLASYLADHVKRRRDRWMPRPRIPPLILTEDANLIQRFQTACPLRNVTQTPGGFFAMWISASTLEFPMTSGLDSGMTSPIYSRSLGSFSMPGRSGGCSRLFQNGGIAQTTRLLTDIIVNRIEISGCRCEVIW